MMRILQVKLVIVFILLEWTSASVEIDKVQYYKSLTPQERQEIFNTDDENHVPNFEIININFPRLQKRSLDEIIPLTLPLSNKNINLNLKLAAPLVGPNTPVYDFRTEATGKITAGKTFPFKEYTFNVYEDENQLASLVIDVDADGNKYVHSGIIGAHNISIHRAPSHQNPELQSCFIINFIDNLLNDGRRSIGGPVNTPTHSPTNSPVKIPDVIYPEILVMVDTSLYNKYTHIDAFIKYVLKFWTTVNLKYKTLSQPKYKLSIAGIVTAKDRSAFSFINSHLSRTRLNFNDAIVHLQDWLYSNQHIIPIQSYDVAIAHTLLSSTSKGWFSTKQEVGLASLRGACGIGPDKRVTKTGIIYDDNNYGSIYTAAHELAHTLGAYHDDNSGCAGSRYIMSAVAFPNDHKKNLGWSQCSLNGFQEFLRTNPQCLYNVPESYQKKAQIAITPLKVNIDINDQTNNSTQFKSTKTELYPKKTQPTVTPPSKINIKNHIDNSTKSISTKSELYPKKTQLTVSPPSKTNFKNHTGNSTKIRKFAVYEKSLIGWLNHKPSSIIPVDIRDKFVDNTNIKYSELDYIVPDHHYTMMYQFMMIQYDPQKMPPNTVMEILLVDKKEIFVFFLDRKMENTTITKLNDQISNKDLL